MRFDIDHVDYEVRHRSFNYEVRFYHMKLNKYINQYIVEKKKLIIQFYTLLISYEQVIVKLNTRR